MKNIPLSKGKFAIVDNEDYERLVAFGKWCISVNGYAVKTFAITKPDGKKSSMTVRMHRIVINAENGIEVDHINGNCLDNRKCNLRLCTRAENSRNVKRHKNNKNGLKGVRLHRGTKKWEARIQAGGKGIYLGLFTCRIEAAKAYNEAAVKYHGEFARLNKI